MKPEDKPIFPIIRDRHFEDSNKQKLIAYYTVIRKKGPGPDEQYYCYDFKRTYLQNEINPISTLLYFIRECYHIFILEEVNFEFSDDQGGYWWKLDPDQRSEETRLKKLINPNYTEPEPVKPPKDLIEQKPYLEQSHVCFKDGHNFFSLFSRDDGRSIYVIHKCSRCGVEEPFQYDYA
jgi:hypothetical protein